MLREIAEDAEKGVEFDENPIEERPRC